MSRAIGSQTLTYAEPDDAVSAPFRSRSMVVPAGEGAKHAAPSVSAAEALVDLLVALGVQHVFGVIGGGIAPFCEAVSRSPLEFVHCRHEGGAAFAAVESSLASGRPAVVVATTGPGLTNLYTGMFAARTEGAKVLFFSGCTTAEQRGRGAFQETSSSGAYGPLFSPGPLFHHAQIVEHPDELPALGSRLVSGCARPNGFVAHVGLPLGVQTARVAQRPLVNLTSLPPLSCDANVAAHAVELLSQEPFVIWAGFGARHAAEAVRELAERAQAHVMCSPRGKGIMPEDHPLFLGVTGLGGHAAVEEHFRAQRPARVLVLGSRLGEMTSFWSSDLLPRDGLIHVDLDADAFGTAYPDTPTLCVQAEIGSFLAGVLSGWPQAENDSAPQSRPVPSERAAAPRTEALVRPSFLMAQIQRHVVEDSDALLLTEAGNSFMLGSHFLRFRSPGRYRVSTGFGSMGQAAGGVLGAAMARGRAVALVGDGAMLMLNEMSTAANYGINAVWIVLNDARYGMIARGMQSLGWEPFATDFPRADFVSIAHAMGVRALRVEREAEVAVALQMALQATGPFVLDVLIDPSEAPPLNRRNKSLIEQGGKELSHDR